MGLDGTTKRPDDQPLGSVAVVQSALADIFPGVTRELSLTGLHQLQTAKAQGIVFPAIIREHMASAPAVYEGDYVGTDFSIEFYAEAADTILEVNVVLRGTTMHCEPLFALLNDRHGWLLTHP